MKKNQINILKDRGIILVSGKDSKEFLQNIITNDINKVKETNTIFSGIFIIATITTFIFVRKLISNYSIFLSFKLIS